MVLARDLSRLRSTPQSPSHGRKVRLLLCAEAVYNQKIAGFPVGDAPSSNTVYNRTVPLRKIYKQLGSKEPICIDGQYPWLTDVDGVVVALQSVYTVKSTRELAQLAILQFCEALGRCTLQQKYFNAFAKLQPLPEPDKKILTKPQVAEIRKKNNKLVDTAIKALHTEQTVDLTREEKGIHLDLTRTAIHAVHGIL